MKIFKHQQWHILILIVLLFLLYYCIVRDAAFLNGELWGISTSTWLTLAILSPIIHQVYVLVSWVHYYFTELPDIKMIYKGTFLINTSSPPHPY